MKKTKFTQEKTVTILRERESGAVTAEGAAGKQVGHCRAFDMAGPKIMHYPAIWGAQHYFSESTSLAQSCIVASNAEILCATMIFSGAGRGSPICQDGSHIHRA